MSLLEGLGRLGREPFSTSTSIPAPPGPPLGPGEQGVGSLSSPSARLKTLPTPPGCPPSFQAPRGLKLPPETSMEDVAQVHDS